ncbi:unnamed protein product [Bemisia tabaci]|uniref:diacylglycerol cholinephosphotransferase n=1 Tax=Bemisia tabaci TaxID=7038 RepID=A0A9P0A656_BEMTA|nr:PREDICTED: cholinephosphotransferase 1 isoform X3 [Bemisia tabaci]CAH0385409.1 unnamed protein product [Bemisia tabaci]
MFEHGRILSPVQLKRLSEHKYSYESKSLLDSFLQPWWNFLVNRVPLWLAPNLITLTGLIINILTSLILIWHSPDAKSDVPRWACFVCALGLFIYQSLDAIDGKQARRTSSSNPLGELFDHGCDSISTVFVAVSACISVKMGNSPGWMFFQCFCACTLFYCAHWQTYVSGTMRFGRVDVTEAQFTIILIHLISTVFGPDIWLSKIPSLSLIDIRFVIVIFTVLGCSLALYTMFQIILSGGTGKNGSTVALPLIGVELKSVPVGVSLIVSAYLAHASLTLIFSGGVGKNGSSVAGTSVLSPIIPYSFVLIPALIIYRKSPEHVYETNPVLYILAFGLVTAKVTNRLVVAHMTKNELDYVDSSMYGPLMLFLNQYFNCFISEYTVLWLCLIWATLDLFLYCKRICMEICEHLRIRLFRIDDVSAAGDGLSKNGSNSNPSRTTKSKRQAAHH